MLASRAPHTPSLLPDSSSDLPCLSSLEEAMRSVYKATYVTLHVRKSNKAALGLYRDSLGFKVDKVEEKYCEYILSLLRGVRYTKVIQFSYFRRGWRRRLLHETNDDRLETHVSAPEPIYNRCLALYLQSGFGPNRTSLVKCADGVYSWNPPLPSIVRHRLSGPGGGSRIVNLEFLRVCNSEGYDIARRVVAFDSYQGGGMCTALWRVARIYDSSSLVGSSLSAHAWTAHLGNLMRLMNQARVKPQPVGFRAFHS